MDNSFNINLHTPAASLEPVDTDYFKLSEIPLMGRIIIRGKAEDNDFLQAAQTVLSVALPLTANTSVEGKDKNRVFWLGPDEWMVWTPTLARSEALLEELTQAFTTLHTACVNVSDYYTTIKISGKHATSVLAYGCPLDLREKSFRPTDCAQSLFRHTGIFIYKVDKDCYHIQVRWSFTEYLWEFFSTSASTIKE